MTFSKIVWFLTSNLFLSISTATIKLTCLILLFILFLGLKDIIFPLLSVLIKYSTLFTVTFVSEISVIIYLEFKEIISGLTYDIISSIVNS